MSDPSVVHCHKDEAKQPVNDLVVCIIVVSIFVVAAGISYYVAKQNAIQAIKKMIEEKCVDKNARTPMTEKDAINLEEELRKNAHDRRKDFFVMAVIAGLIVVGVIFLWPRGSESHSGVNSEATGWAVGALDTLLGVVVGYGLSKNDKKQP